MNQGSLTIPKSFKATCYSIVILRLEGAFGLTAAYKMPILAKLGLVVAV